MTKFESKIRKLQRVVAHYGRQVSSCESRSQSNCRDTGRLRRTRSRRALPSRSMLAKLRFVVIWAVELVQHAEVELLEHPILLQQSFGALQRWVL